MSDKTSKESAGVPGRFYVDRTCIGCAVCAAIAPANFRTDQEEGYDYVYKQPADTTEEQLCAEALDICPAGAIGDDGDG